jgi:hypothetical protein
MSDYFHQNIGQISDGLYFGLGILAVYLGAILSGAIIRSLSGAGSSGITLMGRYVRGWWDYLRGDDRNVINVTLNMIVDDHLKFDTLVADRRIWFVWPNAYRVYLIRRPQPSPQLQNFNLPSATKVRCGKGWNKKYFLLPILSIPNASDPCCVT